MSTCWAGFRGMVWGTRPNSLALTMFLRPVGTRCARTPWWNWRYNTSKFHLLTWFQNVYLWDSWTAATRMLLTAGHGSSCSDPRQAQTKNLGQHFYVWYKDCWWAIWSESCLLSLPCRPESIWLQCWWRLSSSSPRWSNTNMRWTRSPSLPET